MFLLLAAEWIDKGAGHELFEVAPIHVVLGFVYVAQLHRYGVGGHRLYPLLLFNSLWFFVTLLLLWQVLVSVERAVALSNGLLVSFAEALAHALVTLIVFFSNCAETPHRCFSSSEASFRLLAF